MFNRIVDLFSCFHIIRFLLLLFLLVRASASLNMFIIFHKHPSIIASLILSLKHSLHGTPIHAQQNDETRRRTGSNAQIFSILHSIAQISKCISPAQLSPFVTRTIYMRATSPSLFLLLYTLALAMHLVINERVYI